MKIEKQVCNIEQSKKLLQLGIAKNKSYLTWLEAAEYDEMGSKIIEWHPCLFYEHKGDYECCYCPVSMEVVSNDDEFIETKGKATIYDFPQAETRITTKFGYLFPFRVTSCKILH